MMKTADSSFELTLFAKGKHHISDFLPKEELGKFFKKVESVKGIIGFITSCVSLNSKSN